MLSALKRAHPHPPLPALQLAVGDLMPVVPEAAGSAAALQRPVLARVTAIERLVDVGLFMPHTLTGARVFMRARSQHTVPAGSSWLPGSLLAAHTTRRLLAACPQARLWWMASLPASSRMWCRQRWRVLLSSEASPQPSAWPMLLSPRPLWRRSWVLPPRGRTAPRMPRSATQPWWQPPRQQRLRRSAHPAAKAVHAAALPTVQL